MSATQKNEQLAALERIEQTLRRIDREGSSLSELLPAIAASTQNLKQATVDLAELHDVHQQLKSLTDTVRVTKETLRVDHKAYSKAMMHTIETATRAQGKFRSIHFRLWVVMVLVCAVTWVAAMWSLRTWTPEWFLTEAQQDRMVTPFQKEMAGRFPTVWWSLTTEQRETLNESEGWTYRTTKQEDETPSTPSTPSTSDNSKR
jgi:hypothetical protein